MPTCQDHRPPGKERNIEAPGTEIYLLTETTVVGVSAALKEAGFRSTDAYPKQRPRGSAFRDPDVPDEAFGSVSSGSEEELVLSAQLAT